MKTYYDEDGNERSLDWLVRNSPEWAANRMRSDRTEIEYWRKYAAAIETERDEARAHLTIRRTELEHTYSEIERLESVVTDTDAAMYEANAEMERLREICDALYSDKERLREALERMTTDCMESDFNEHWDTFKNAEAVLAEKEDKT